MTAISEAELAQCFGKEAFKSIELANRVSDRRNRRGKRGRPYKCPHCGDYHIGWEYPMDRRRYK